MIRLLWTVATAMLLLTACNNYGKKVVFHHNEIYYKGSGVTETDAQRLGAFLWQSGYFDSTKASTVQLLKEDAAYVVKMVVDEEEIARDKAFYQRFFWYLQEPMAQNVFAGAKTKIILADGGLNDLEAVGDIAIVKANAKSRVLYNPDGIAEADAQNLSDFLAQTGYFNGHTDIDILLHKTGNEYTVRFLVDKAVLNEDRDQFISLFKIYKYFIGQGVFNGQKTHAFLTSFELNDLEVLADLSEEEKAAVREQAAASPGNSSEALQTNAEETPEP